MSVIDCYPSLDLPDPICHEEEISLMNELLETERYLKSEISRLTCLYKEEEIPEVRESLKSSISMLEDARKSNKMQLNLIYGDFYGNSGRYCLN